MDRFIDVNFDILRLRTLDLKSNMDRFIEADTGHLKGIFAI